MRHLLVALTGEKGSGKGVLARHLAQKHGFQIDSFAAPLKRMCTHLMGWTAEQLADPVFKETVDPRFGFAPRWFMQHLATECIRKEFGEDVWSKALLKRVLRLTHDADDRSNRPSYRNQARVVVDDLRFLSEAETLKPRYARGAPLREAGVQVFLIRINRGGRPETGDVHVSEQEIYQMDVDEELDVTWYPGEGGAAIGEADLIRDFETVLKQNGFL